MKRIILPLLLLFVTLSFGARKLPPVPVFTATDSIQVVTLDWKIKEIAPGIIYKEVHDPQLFGKAPQNISLLEIDPQKANVQLYIGYTEKCVKTSETAIQNEAIAAINGSFFNVKQEFPVNYLKLNGKSLFPTTKSEAAGRATGAILITKDKVSVEPWNLQIEAADNTKAENVLVSGPILLHQGKIISLRARDFNLYRHPRTAFGITKTGKLIFFVVDGRFSNISDGMNLFEMAYFARVSGYSDFINLDGGGSSTMWIKGANETGIVNHPCDNNRFDNKGEREVSTILYIK